MRRFLCILALGLLFLSASVDADVYMHWLRGSNNRFRGPNNNQQRLFNSQNNAKGGYNVGELNPDDSDADFTPGHMQFFAGSVMNLEWTNQHSCGVNNNALCELIFQYACTPSPGTGTRQYNGQPWTLKDDNANGDDDHEPAAYQTKCNTRSRNRGLFTSDQKLNGNTAQFTRQNPGGTQHGTECQEERDYYPYWHPTPFKDIVVMTSNVSRCPYYQAESQNVKAKGECECATWSTTGCGATSTCWTYNNPTQCTANQDTNTNTQCVWADKTYSQAFKGSAAEDQLGAPECIVSPYTRDNHLGNGENVVQPNYLWTVPDPQQACGASRCTCTLRLRYNMSSIDLHELKAWQLPTGVNPQNVSQDYFFVDSLLNGNRKILMDAKNYYSDNTNMDLGVRDPIQIGHNTNQLARAFQDRAHLFEIWSRPSNIANVKVYNVGVRGKRGNIVQAYPGVEYDFNWQVLNMTEGECIHFQWTGSNSNPNNNEGQGKAGSDRSNIVQIASQSVNFPLPESQVTLFPAPTNANNNIQFFASGGYTGSSTTIPDAAVPQGTPASFDKNMNNVSPTFNGAYMNGGTMTSPNLVCPAAGTYHYASTRNNNFTNRSQKGIINVAPRA